MNSLARGRGEKTEKECFSCAETAANPGISGSNELFAACLLRFDAEWNIIAPFDRKNQVKTESSQTKCVGKRPVWSTEGVTLSGIPENGMGLRMDGTLEKPVRDTGAEGASESKTLRQKDRASE